MGLGLVSRVERRSCHGILGFLSSFLGSARHWAMRRGGLSFPPTGGRPALRHLAELGGVGVVSRGLWKQTPEPSQSMVFNECLSHDDRWPRGSIEWSHRTGLVDDDTRSLIRLAAVVPFVALPGQELS